MNHSFARLVTGLGLIVSVFSLSVYSATIVNGGVIPQQRQFAMSCPDNNRMQTRMVSYEEALNGKVSDSDLVSLRMKYLNPEKTLAVVEIQYR